MKKTMWILAVLLLAAITAFTRARADAPTNNQVLMIEQTYDGPVEVAGDLYHFRYSGGYLLVIWGDKTKDGIFRSGFDLPPSPPIEIPPMPIEGEAVK